MSPTIHHTLTNFVRGWSGFYINPLDIRKIRRIMYHKRLFCFLDPEYKYTLSIRYYDPRSEYGPNLVFTNKGTSIILSETYEEESHMTVRYKTEYEVKKEIENINKLRDQIKQFDEIENHKLENFISNNNNHLA